MNAEDAAVSWKQWEFIQAWASGLSDKDLRAVKRLKVPGEAGLAAEQEHGRRFSPYARMQQAASRTAVV